jgi:hypothetical protein
MQSELWKQESMTYKNTAKCNQCITGDACELSGVCVSNVYCLQENYLLVHASSKSSIKEREKGEQDCGYDILLCILVPI